MRNVQLNFSYDYDMMSEDYMQEKEFWCLGKSIFQLLEPMDFESRYLTTMPILIWKGGGRFFLHINFVNMFLVNLAS